jgi:hypothetical protein
MAQGFTGRKFQIIGMNATIVAMCSCGNPSPLIIPYIPGSGGGCQCAACGTQWALKKLDASEPLRTEENAGRVQATCNIDLHAIIPRIVRPAVQ